MTTSQRNELYRYLASDYCWVYGRVSTSYNFKFLLRIIKRCSKTWLFWFRCASSVVTKDVPAGATAAGDPITLCLKPHLTFDIWERSYYLD